MTVLLTIVAVALALSIAALLVWEVLHRRSPLVRAWRPSTMPGRVTGGLGMLTDGHPHDRLRSDEPETVLLLHGLGGTSDYFGDLYEGLAGEHRLVMVDLLGFGRSLDDHRTDFSIDAHVAAIDGALESIGAGSDRVCVAAFSMGSAVALSWAARHAGRVTEVVLWGPPTYPGEMTDDEIVAESGPLTKLVWSERPTARRICRWQGRHRWAAGWVMAAFAPRFPVSVSRWASHHSWLGYRTSFEQLVLGASWSELFADVDAPITVFRGTEDPVGRRTTLAQVAPRSTIVDVDDADHHIPITHPQLLFEQLGS
ncbi:MAG: alpha/beta fold hydrolase [Actinomycetota bacterium]